MDGQSRHANGLRIVLLALAAGAACGCTWPAYRVYDGPRRPLKDVAAVMVCEPLEMRRIDYRPVPEGISNASRRYTAEYHLLPGRHTLSARNYVDRSLGKPRSARGGFAGARALYLGGMLSAQLELEAGRVYELVSALRPVGPGPPTALDPNPAPRRDWVLAVKSVYTVESFALRRALAGGGPSHWRTLFRNHATTLSTLDIARLDLRKAGSTPRKGSAKVLDEMKKATAVPGVREIQEGNYGAAIRKLTQLLASSPKDVDALVNRGVAYERAGRWGEAATDLGRVLEIGPHGPAYLNRAVTYHRMGRTAEAQADLRRALELCLAPGFRKTVARTLRVITPRRKR